MTEEEIEEFVITDHAYERAKSRMNWNKKIIQKMMLRAYEKGKMCNDKDKLERILTKLSLGYGRANDIRIYGDVIYLFHNKVLITLYQIPRKFLKYK